MVPLPRNVAYANFVPDNVPGSHSWKTVPVPLFTTSCPVLHIIAPSAPVPAITLEPTESVSPLARVISFTAPHEASKQPVQLGGKYTIDPHPPLLRLCKGGVLLGGKGEELTDRLTIRHGSHRHCSGSLRWHTNR